MSPEEFPAARGNAVRWRRSLVVVCYLAPLLLLAAFYGPTGPPWSVFLRNWLRAGCGPAVQVLWWCGLDPNDLATYAIAFGLLWPAWLLVVTLSPLRRLPLAAHAVLGSLWCLGGCGLTLAI
jgi:hypothetical protein